MRFLRYQLLYIITKAIESATTFFLKHFFTNPLNNEITQKSASLKTVIKLRVFFKFKVNLDI